MPIKIYFNFSISSKILQLFDSPQGNLYMTVYKNSVLLFDDNKIKMARKPGKKQKENPVGYTREGKI